MLDFKDDLFLLKEQAINSDDKIIYVFTKNYGKRIVKLRGGNKLLSKLNPHLQLFSLCSGDFIVGKKLDYIANVISYEIYKEPVFNFKKNIAFCFMLELVDKYMVVGFSDSKVFDLCIKYFEIISSFDTVSYNYIDIKKDREFVFIILSFFVEFMAMNGYNVEIKEKIFDNKDNFLSFLYFYIEKYLKIEKFFV